MAGDDVTGTAGGGKDGLNAEHYHYDTCQFGDLVADSAFLFVQRSLPLGASFLSYDERSIMNRAFTPRVDRGQQPTSHSTSREALLAQYEPPAWPQLCMNLVYQGR